RALEDSHKQRSNQIASELAVLLEAAGEFGRCAEYFYEAARNAREVFAFEEAVLLAGRGLSAIGSIEVTPEVTPRLQRTKVLLQLTLGGALAPINGFGNEEVRA